MASNPTRARIARGRSITHAYARANGLDGEDLATQLRDLITDLLHLAGADEADWRAVLAAAITDYTSEVIGPGEGLVPSDWEYATLRDLAARLGIDRAAAAERLVQADVGPLLAELRRRGFDLYTA